MRENLVRENKRLQRCCVLGVIRCERLCLFFFLSLSLSLLSLQVCKICFFSKTKCIHQTRERRRRTNALERPHRAVFTTADADVGHCTRSRGFRSAPRGSMQTHIIIIKRASFPHRLSSRLYPNVCLRTIERPRKDKKCADSLAEAKDRGEEMYRLQG